METRRSTQRQPLACRSCTKSKVRCDKQIPCSRCVKRKVLCEREEVSISSKGPRRKTSTSRDEATTRSQTGSDIRGNVAHTSASGDTTAILYDPSSSLFSLKIRQKSVLEAVAQPHFDDIATCIEGLAWGRHQCFRYPHRQCLKFDDANITEHQIFANSQVLQNLPDVSIARQLVEFHTRFLRWYHGVLHEPTFLKQCEELWSNRIIEDGQWLALYCAVLSSAAWTLCNTTNINSSIDRDSLEYIAILLFDTMIDVLNLEGFMAKHSIQSLQAICVAGMIGNVLGKSDLLTTLVSSGIRIAQCLGLHHIQGMCQGETSDETIEKEVGRRVWWQLVQMDHHSMPYTGTISIDLRHMSTALPLNCNDHDLRALDERTVTPATYCSIMLKMSLLIPRLLDGISSIQDVGRRYEHVIDIDRQMRMLVKRMPTAMLRRPDADQVEPEWLDLARHTLAIAAADKIIMIHRSFLHECFRTPAYLFTRNTCTAAALTILREHELLYSSHANLPRIWVHSAFCVTAVVVICLNLLYCPTSLGDQKRQHYLELIESARERLSTSRIDTMARRGVFLIDAMLGGGNANGNAEFEKPEIVQILQRFLQSDQRFGHQAYVPSVPIAEDFELGDFDQWFTDMFGS